MLEKILRMKNTYQVINAYGWKKETKKKNLLYGLFIKEIGSDFS